ncbi:hypothetical protein BHM03_00003296 [Ensete ventricosum]|nr:hypothetical protein BHM03_00003296 [Ensete ventricosum]
MPLHKWHIASRIEHIERVRMSISISMIRDIIVEVVAHAVGDHRICAWPLGPQVACPQATWPQVSPLPISNLPVGRRSPVKATPPCKQLAPRNRAHRWPLLVWPLLALD